VCSEAGRGRDPDLKRKRDVGPTSERLPPPQPWPWDSHAIGHGRLVFTDALLLPASPNLRSPPREEAAPRLRAREVHGVRLTTARRRGDARAGEERQAHCCTGEFPNGSFSHCAPALNLVDFVVPLHLSSFCEAQVSNFT
jgi:hypothetical protein